MMMRRDWSLFKYELADFFFKNQMDEAFREGQRSGVEYASRKLGFAVRNLDTSKMTKTQKIGHEASMAAIVEAKKEVMSKTGVAL
jgi:hypothetical protein